MSETSLTAAQNTAEYILNLYSYHIKIINREVDEIIMDEIDTKQSYLVSNAEAQEALDKEIQAGPLTFDVRKGWTPFNEWNNINDNDTQPDEFQLLMATGGPAVRITGNVGLHCEALDIEIQHHDWFESWQTWYPESEEDRAALREAIGWYCENFTHAIETL